MELNIAYFSHRKYSVSKKTDDFSQVVYKKLQEQGLALLKAKEFTNVNDCFQKGHNAVIGVFL